MPRRIVSLRRRAETGGLTALDAMLLIYGRSYHAMHTLPRPSDDALRALWRRHRAQLLSWCRDGIPADAFVEKPFGFLAGDAQGLFARPWAWWKFEAPEMRKLIAVENAQGDARPPTAADEKNAWAHGDNFFGAPSGACGGLYAFEDDAEYLERHGLLTREERKALKTERAKPVRDEEIQEAAEEE